jgi:hypothetical protein
MKTLACIAFYLITFYATAQLNPIDQFFSDNPLDLHLGSHINDFSIRTDMGQTREGYTSNVAGGIGWRYSLIKNDNVSLAPRIAFSGGYVESNGNTTFTFHVPLTLNLAIGAGSSPQNESDFGVVFGGGYAGNIHNYTRTISDNTYSKENPYFSPVVYTAFNFKYNTTIFGIMPFYSWTNDHQFIGIQLIGYVLFE